LSSDLSKFAELGLAPTLLDAIADTGYTTPTPIQAKAIPLVLAGGDLLAAAQTGTGKTAGFTLPLLQRLQESAKGRARPGRPRCLILTPTRELAAQIAESVQTYGKHLPLKSLVVFGGVNINPQRMAMRKPIDILIATPGRLLDLVGQNIVNLSEIDILVLDEADRMLDMGFIHDIKKVLRLLPSARQSLLFSATFSSDIRKLAHKLLDNPQEVSVTPRNTTTELVDQTVHMVDKSKKRQLLSLLIKQHDWSQVLIFTKTKHGANRLAEQLGKDGIEALAIHGNKSQAARTKALAKFKDGSLQVLVATDIAARGIDIEHLPNVVNYELPHVSEDYVHRIGRTGRAGSTGQAISLVNIDEIKLLKGIEKLIGKKIPQVEIEGYTGHSEAPGSTVVERKPRPPRRSRSDSGQSRNAQGSNGTSGKRQAASGQSRRARNGAQGGRSQGGGGYSGGYGENDQSGNRQTGNTSSRNRQGANGNRQGGNASSGNRQNGADNSRRQQEVNGNRLDSNANSGSRQRNHHNSTGNSKNRQEANGNRRGNNSSGNRRRRAS